MVSDATTSRSPDVAPAATAAAAGGSDPTPRRAGGITVLRWVLRQHRRALIGWTVAVAVVCGIYVSFWPAMGDAGELDALIEGMPEGLVAAMGYDAIGTPAGYLESTVFGLLGPILLLVFGLTFAAKLVAGEEEDGTLELELSSPVARGSVYLQRYLAVVVALLWLCLVVALVTVGLIATLDMEVGTPEVLATTLGMYLLVLAFASLAFAAGAATGRKAIALAVGAGLAVLSYIANALAPLLDDGQWLEAISPFAWYLASEPLVDGLSVPGALGLVAWALVPAGLAIVRFDRRDLGV